MRRKLLALGAFALAFAVSALAGDIRIAPESIYLGDVESFLTVQGSGFTQASIVTIDGPGGTFNLEVSSIQGTTAITVWIPLDVAGTAGEYNVTVDTPTAGGSQHDGPATFTVIGSVVPQPPTIFVPETVSLDATSLSGAVVTFEVSAVSYVDPTPPVVTCDHESGALYPLGNTLVTCTASDSFGTAYASFPIFVQDVTAPQLTLPADIVSSSHVVTWTASAIDAVDGSVPVLCSPASGSTFATGTTTVNCRAVDNQANTAFGSFTVTVVDGPPHVYVPANITAEATSPSGAVVTYEATTDPGATINCSPASGSTFALGTTTVNCTATNPLGSASGSFTVTVVDTTPPQIVSITASPSVLWPPDHKMRSVTINVVAFDLADSSPASHIVSVSSSQPVNGKADGHTSADWNVTGPLTVDLRAERAGNADRVYTITVETVDASGNKTQSTVTVTVQQQPNANSSH
jgi:hypothetical protein